MINSSLGVFETNSISASLKAVEIFQKEKSVKIIGKQFLGDGIVTIIVEGSLGAIKKIFTAGADETSRIKGFRNSSIIPLPHPELLKKIEVEK